MPTHRLRLLSPLLFASSWIFAQAPASKPSPPPSSQILSPKAAYDDAMQPLASTRHAISNWSETEVAALKVTIGRAAENCHARSPHDFAGDDLIDLTRLCSLGQAYPEVAAAATKYLAAEGPKPFAAQAYAALIDADLRTKDEAGALKAVQTMLATLRYGSTVAGAVDEVINYLQFLNTTDALNLVRQRQPLLLALIRQTSPSASANTDDSPQTLHDLYLDGLSFAALQQLKNTPDRDVASAAIVTELDHALPASLAPDDALPIATLRRRYAMLGKPLPSLAGATYLRSPDPFPTLPSRNAITALLVFPDWCAQCVRMALHLPESVFTVSKHEAYLYGLLAETVPPEKPTPHTDTKAERPFAPAQAAGLLLQTPTLASTVAVLDQFAVTDVPFLVLTDGNGIIRVLQPVDENAIQPGNTIDSAIAFIGGEWPITPRPGQPTAKPTAAHPTAH